MTREEAIQNLKSHKSAFQHDFGWDFSTTEALDMAIEALKDKYIIHADGHIEPLRKEACWVPIDQEPHETWKCGLCGFVLDTSSWRNPEVCRDSYKYCPSCGAKMKNADE